MGNVSFFMHFVFFFRRLNQDLLLVATHYIEKDLVLRKMSARTPRQSTRKKQVSFTNAHFKIISILKGTLKNIDVWHHTEVSVSVKQMQKMLRFVNSYFYFQ